MATQQDFIDAATAGFQAVATKRNADVATLGARINNADLKAEAAVAAVEGKLETDFSNLPPEDILTARQTLGLGSGALANVGVAAGQIGLLGENGKFPAQFIPDADNVSYLGGWDASANDPEIVSGAGINGKYYKVTVVGNTVIDGFPADPATQQWNIGDEVRYNGTVTPGRWERIPGASAANKLDTDGANAPTEPTAREAFLANIYAAPKGFTHTETGAVETDMLAYLMENSVQPAQFDVSEFSGTGTPVDTRAELQALLNAAKASRSPEVVLTKGYYIKSGTLTIPTGVSVRGVVQGGEAAGRPGNPTPTRPGVIVLGTGATIKPQTRSALRDLTVISLNAITPPMTRADAVTRINAWSGRAIQIDPYQADVEIDNCYIVGFEYGIYSTWAERWIISRNKIDCKNGFYADNTYDVGHFHWNHMWPFWSSNYAFPDGDITQAYKRSGVGITSYGPNDGCLYTNNLVFGYQTGILVQGAGSGTDSNNYANRFRGNWIDNRSGVWGSTVTYGIRTLGAVRLCNFEDNHIDQVNIGMDLAHVPNQSGRPGVQVRGATFGNCLRRWIRCGTGDGIIDGMIAGGGTGNYGIEFQSGSGIWLIDNVYAVDAQNNESSGGRVKLINGNSASYANIKLGQVRALNNIDFDYREFGTDVIVDRNGSDASYAGSNAEYVIPFTTERSDTLAEYSTTTYIFTAKVAGPYFIENAVSFTPNDGTARSVRIQLQFRANGSSTWSNIAEKTELADAAIAWNKSFSTLRHLVVGDSLRVVFQSSQPATINGDSRFTRFAIYRLPTVRG